MGPPPKYLIERKLIKSISKKVIPKNPLIPPEYFSGLMNCWKTHGIGSNKCLDEELKYDFVINCGYAGSNRDHEFQEKASENEYQADSNVRNEEASLPL